VVRKNSSIVRSAGLNPEPATELLKLGSGWAGLVRRQHISGGRAAAVSVARRRGEGHTAPDERTKARIGWLMMTDERRTAAAFTAA